MAMKMRCLSQYAISEIVLPLILCIEIFSEPGVENLFRELFGLKWDANSLLEATNRRLSFTLLQDENNSPLISENDYTSKVLPFLETAILIRQYEVRVICLRLLPWYDVPVI